MQIFINLPINKNHIISLDIDPNIQFYELLNKLNELKYDLKITNNKNNKNKYKNFNYNLNNCYFSYNGKPLNLLTKINDYNLTNGCTINVLLRLLGSATFGKVVKGPSKLKNKNMDSKDDERRFARIKETEEQRKRAMLIKEDLKNKMELEKKHSKMNRLKIQNHFRKIMRGFKVESLRDDIKILSQTHERDVDRKDAIIRMLDRDLDESEDQYQMALRSHLENIDKLIDLHDSRLLSLEQEFEYELNILREDFGEEKEMIINQHNNEVRELTDIINAIDEEEKEKENDAKQNHEQAREELRNKDVEEINVLRITLDTQIEELEQHFDTAHYNYLQNTDQRTTDFKYFTSKDQEMSRDIELKIRKVERVYSSIHHWRAKINQSMKESTERNRLLQEEKNIIQGHFQQLKSRMNRFRNKQERKLSKLTQVTHKTKHKTRDRINLAERILKLSELSRKLETEQEKILPFADISEEEEKKLREEAENEYKEMKTNNNLFNNKNVEPGNNEYKDYQSCPLDEKNHPVNRWRQMENYWKRYNKILLDKMSLENEKNELEEENQQLESLVKQYLNGMTVNDDVLNNENGNPLMVINGNTGLTRALPVRRQQRTILEANNLVRTGKVNVSIPL